MDLSKLKKNRGLAGLQKLQEQIEKNQTDNKRQAEDDRYWKPTVDKSGNGSALIRFLPAPGEEAMPWVRYWSHGFQGPTGKWYIEKSLTTIGKSDPVSDYNSRLWNTGRASDKDVARRQKRKLNYVSNILVIKDPKNPDAEGNVYLFRYGKKIFDKINEAMYPPEDEIDPKDPINPFCPFEGADFKLVVRKVEGYPNYDRSEFQSPEAVGSDDEIEAIWGKEYSLDELISESEFKDYEELQRKLDLVLGVNTTIEKVVEQDEEENDDAISDEALSTDDDESDTDGEYDDIDDISSLLDDLDD